MNSRVSIVKAKKGAGQEEISAAVRRSLDLIGGPEGIFSAGQTVLINPNWAAARVKREEAVITLPEVAKAVADLVTAQGARALIAESSAIGVDSEKVIQASGYNDLRNRGYEVIDLKKTPTTMLPVEDGRVLKELETYQLVQEADLIVTLPKLKTHDQAEVTCALKNSKGLLSDDFKRRFHWEFGLYDAVVDMNTLIKPVLAVVDAIVCQEGLGPVFGRPVEMGLIVAGRDLVAVDSVCGRIGGFEPEEAPITLRAAERGLGIADLDQIEVVGERIEDVARRFLRAAEDDPVMVEGFRIITGETACTGCRTTTMSALKDMETSNFVKYLKGVVVITGQDAVMPEEVNPARVVHVGRCIPKEERGRHYAPGCPPSMTLIADKIVGVTEKDKKVVGKANEETGAFYLELEERKV